MLCALLHFLFIDRRQPAEDSPDDLTHGDIAHVSSGDLRLIHGLPKTGPAGFRSDIAPVHPTTNSAEAQRNHG